jgi:hypothetical protein
MIKRGLITGERRKKLICILIGGKVIEDKLAHLIQPVWNLR